MTPRPTDEPAPLPVVIDASAENTQAADLAACISALVDGDAAAAEAACARWRDDPLARRSWHAYHLIGDVMRSDELATSPVHDAAFVGRLRARLATEPVALVPQAPQKQQTTPTPRRRQGWLVPLAAAAGFVVIGGMLVLTRTAAPDDGVGTGTVAGAGDHAGVVATAATGSTRADLTAAGPRASAVLASRQLAPPVLPERNNGLIRDPRLDEYLRAHQSAGGLAVATPGGWLRRVDAVVTQPPER